MYKASYHKQIKKCIPNCKRKLRVDIPPKAKTSKCLKIQKFCKKGGSSHGLYRIAFLERLGGFLAEGLGFEPRLAESESAVLPLDDPPVPSMQLFLLSFRILRFLT